MKNLILFLALVLLAGNKSTAQTEPRLKERLDSILLATQQMDFEKIMDFTYPKLFTIVPREQMLQAIASSFKSDEFEITIDSVNILNIYPVFTAEGGQFAKATHTLLMLMKFKDTSDKEENIQSQEMIAEMMKKQFGEEKVSYNKKEKKIKINMIAEIAAVKDKYAPDWCFVTFKENDQITSMLFSKEIIDKLAAYK